MFTTINCTTLTDDSDESQHHAYVQRRAVTSRSPPVKLTCPIDSREVAFRRLQNGRRGMHSVSTTIHRDTWDRLLCEGVPVSLRELVSLVAEQIQLSPTAHNLSRLLQCSYRLGWHVSSRDSQGVVRHYWGGGLTPNTSSAFKRGDWVELQGTDECRGVETSRLARIICGVEVRHLSKFLPAEMDGDDVWEDRYSRENDTAVYLLVRYAAPHTDVGRVRGPEHRPLCPGILKNTHCLWKWSQRHANYRRGCWRTRPWERHKHMLGATEAEQNLRKEQDARAWYDLIQTTNIIRHTNVNEDWDRPNAFLQSVIWC